MAGTKNTAKPSPSGAKQPKPAAPKGMSDTQRWIYGFALLFFSLFLAMAVLSFFLYWREDQNIALWSHIFTSEDQKVLNWGGKLGAVLANMLVGEWFGLFGLCIPVILVIFSLRIMRYRPPMLRKSVRLSLMLMILGSLTLGYLFGDAWGVFGTGLGGAQGIMVARWLTSVLGLFGAGLLLLLAIILYAIYINRNTISVLTRMGKGIVDNGKRVGEVVGAKAADILSSHESDDPQQEQATPLRAEEQPTRAARVGQEPVAARNGGGHGKVAPETEDDPFIVRGGEQTPLSPGELIDDNGFTVVDRSGNPSFGRSETPTAASEPPRRAGRVAVDDDGFMVTDLNQPAPVEQAHDENGFVIQYARGDDSEPVRPTPPAPKSGMPMRDASDSPFFDATQAAASSQAAASFGAPSNPLSGATPVSSVPHEMPNPTSIPNARVINDQYAARFTSPALPSEMEEGAPSDRMAESGEMPDREDLSVDEGVASQPLPELSAHPFMTHPSDSDHPFVAAVPGGSTLQTSDEIMVEHLPQDESVETDQIENTLYDPTLDLSAYQRPPVELLEDHSVAVSVTSEEIVENKNRIKETLENFGIKIDKIKATVGPTVTLYEIVQAPGVRISKIKNLEDDIAQSLSALGIRIIAPIPGKGTIGIEVPNKDKQIVSMYSIIKSVKFQESTYDIPVVLGKTIQDETFVIDLAKMPHLLVAGATGQGKSVGLNAIITSLLYKKHPSELKLVLVDPKKVELTLYSKLEHHFLAKMAGEEEAIITDTHKVVYTLNSLCIEMDARYNLLRAAEVRKITEYNDKFIHRKLNPQKGHRFLPYIVVIIDEFADLIMTAGREIETPIARIAQLARAVGIHLVIATQRPTTNIITGVIKANFPARIAFRVTSMVDSRTIIDQPGANQLIGRGDMLVSTGSDLIRVQCAFVDTPEIERITEFISNQRGYIGAYELPEYTPDGSDAQGVVKPNDLSQLDAMFEDVARFVVQNQQGSTSSIQRRFSIGYNRAGRVMDQLEMAGVVGKAEGSKPREVLLQDMMSLEHVLRSLDGL